MVLQRGGRYGPHKLLVVLLTVTGPKEYPSRERVGCEGQADQFPTVGSKEGVAMDFFQGPELKRVQKFI